MHRYEHVLVASLLISTFALAPSAAAGIVWIAQASDVQTSDPTPPGSTTLTLPNVDWTVGAPAPAPITRKLANLDPVVRLYTSTETPSTPWVNPLPTAGALPALGSQTVTFTFSAPLLPKAPGLYHVTYTYTASAAVIAPPKMAILVFDLNVLPANQAALAVTGPPEIDELVGFGAPVDLHPTWTVANVGAAGTTLNWTVVESPPAPWLALTPSSSAVPIGTPVTTQAAFDVAGLATGVYSTTLKFRNAAAQNDVAQALDVPVTIHVYDAYEPLGAGCPGTGGLVPQLALTGLPRQGASVAVALTQCVGGGAAFFVVGAGADALPLGFGCTLNVAAPFAVLGPLPLLPAGADGAGAGSLAFVATIPASTPPLPLALSAIVADPGGAGGFAVTPALTFAVMDS